MQEFTGSSLEEDHYLVACSFPYCIFYPTQQQSTNNKISTHTLAPKSNHNKMQCGTFLVLGLEIAVVQNATARLLTGVRTCQHITSLLKDVNWLPICYWAKFRVLLLVYKALNSLEPVYFMDHITPHMPTMAAPICITGPFPSVTYSSFCTCNKQVFYCGSTYCLNHPVAVLLLTPAKRLDM